MDKYLLDILRCPITGQNLRPVPREKLQKLNQAVAAGRLRFQDGEPVERPLDEALITANGSKLYVVDDGIPVMLEEKAIPAEQLEDF